MGYCPADCSDVTLTPQATGQCDLEIRNRNIDRIMFFTCDTDLPNPMTCEGLSPLAADNKLTFSSPLANIDVQDPSFEEIERGDCLPTLRIPTARVIQFQDRVAVDKEGGVSPTTPAVPFFNYDFWKDKLGKQSSLRFAFVYCDGSVVVPRDEKGNYSTASLDAFIKTEKTGSGNSKLFTEYIQGQLNYKGDPLDLGNKPELTSDNEVFDISTCGLY